MFIELKRKYRKLYGYFDLVTAPLGRKKKKRIKKEEQAKISCPYFPHISDVFPLRFFWEGILLGNTGAAL